MPKRIINKSLFLVGCFGLMFQSVASLYAFINDLDLQWSWWLQWLAPLICLAWGYFPALQLQKEPED